MTVMKNEIYTQRALDVWKHQDVLGGKGTTEKGTAQSLHCVFLRKVSRRKGKVNSLEWASVSNIQRLQGIGTVLGCLVPGSSD